MAVVYVIQRQMRYDERKRGLVSRFNLEPAKQYGDLVFLLPSEAGAEDPDGAVQVLRSRLEGINKDDHLLLVGNPCLIGWATAIAADLTDGHVNLLQWHPKERRYLSIRARLWGDGE